MSNCITNVMPNIKSLFKKIKQVWNEKESTEQEIKVNKMLIVLFDEQTTEQVIDTLLLFEEKTKEKLHKIKLQAETDKFVTDFYFGTTQNNKISL